MMNIVKFNADMGIIAVNIFEIFTLFENVKNTQEVIREHVEQNQEHTNQILAKQREMNIRLKEIRSLMTEAKRLRI